MKKKIILLAAVLLLMAAAQYVTSRYQPDEKGSAAAPPPSAASGASADSPSVNGVSAAPDANRQSEEAPAAAASAPDRVPAAPFTLTDLDGNSVSLADLRGKRVYLNFWTTWCKYCKKEMPAMEQVYRDYKEEGLVMLAVDMGESGKKAASYINDNGYTFPVLLDEDKRASEAYQVTSIPVTVLVDPDGRIAYRRIGAMKEEQMREAIEAWLPRAEE
ncbi:TlpA family protein disulfide reductase [Cohnella nanjingensis]|uniref:TlpA family protein disulfide reductase n=1 Tax=Cohnella nanjingensis TaxID=1387779 RepID=A0A7X0VEF0_9BACL|nr:TlpA disulfide reductase family protein [Cohnella nanjingensis]MBB6670208.1 TlpA family protein disulfide reductase [Cohnella nanjingensis]